jgi:hypothetical protein
MPEHHKVKVISIGEIQVHPNADTLGIVFVGGYQCVVKKDNYKVGDLAIYLPPDSVVPQTKPFEFLWADKEFPDGVVPEKYRRITVRRFRKEWSEGLLLPLSDFGQMVHARSFRVRTKGEAWPRDLGRLPITDLESLPRGGTFSFSLVGEGDDVAELLGITHYEEPEPVDLYGTPSTRLQEKGWPRSLRGWFFLILRALGLRRNPLEGTSERAPKDAPPVYDVENFKHYNTTFKQGDEVVVTEKIHGSNGRYMFDGKRMWVGSKNLWKSEKSKCIWRRVLKDYPQIEEWCRAHPKNTLYTEVVPTQKGYDYGTNEKNPTDIFVFDIRDQDGVYWPKDKSLVEIKPVPIIYAGPFDKETINKLAEGKTLVTNAKHIREGIVIASREERYERGLGRVQLKLKSNAFLEAEGKR